MALKLIAYIAEEMIHETESEETLEPAGFANNVRPEGAVVAGKGGK